jgi:hypothetical protein
LRGHGVIVGVGVWREARLRGNLYVVGAVK